MNKYAQHYLDTYFTKRAADQLKPNYQHENENDYSQQLQQRTIGLYGNRSDGYTSTDGYTNSDPDYGPQGTLRKQYTASMSEMDPRNPNRIYPAPPAPAPAPAPVRNRIVPPVIRGGMGQPSTVQGGMQLAPSSVKQGALNYISFFTKRAADQLSPKPSVAPKPPKPSVAPKPSRPKTKSPSKADSYDDKDSDFMGFINSEQFSKNNAPEPAPVRTPLPAVPTNLPGAAAGAAAGFNKKSALNSIAQFNKLALDPASPAQPKDDPNFNPYAKPKSPTEGFGKDFKGFAIKDPSKDPASIFPKGFKMGDLKTNMPDPSKGKKNYGIEMPDPSKDKNWKNTGV